MNDDQLIARLAAANPVPTGTQVREPQPLRFPRRTDSRQRSQRPRLASPRRLSLTRSAPSSASRMRVRRCRRAPHPSLKTQA
jgi:hypothetical protein